MRLFTPSQLSPREELMREGEKDRQTFYKVSQNLATQSTRQPVKQRRHAQGSKDKQPLVKVHGEIGGTLMAGRAVKPDREQ
ncbi:hypothetical protein E2C01_069152 [Portunus trituberculatus]|uniref:Uncharacterized protein n=1 Tax=Portunus trituberculatus TaxID=210409 RepID=A0A5B7HYH3_PORTR|nr:hypothetical protein [Portunus trituberculatus]